jgi:O-methyltransferase
MLHFKTMKKIKSILKQIINTAGYDVRAVDSKLFNARTKKYEGSFYMPLWSPWFADEKFENVYGKCLSKTLVCRERCFVLYSLIKQAISLEGDIVECGVYKGGTAKMILSIIQESKTDKKLYLFDTFSGMPPVDNLKDCVKEGDFSDTSYESVKAFLNDPNICKIHKGLIPDTFMQINDVKKISFAHVDLDIYKSITDCMNFLWDKIVPGGFVVFDDYGFPSCPGARMAVDEFYCGTKWQPLCLNTGQAIVFK